jgi:tetratricopeptide (TPR) repeat protein
MKRQGRAVFLTLLVLFLVIVPVESTLDIEQLIDQNARQGRVMQALYHVEMLAAQDGWTPDLHQRAGDLWAQAGDVTRAIPHWRSAGDDPALLRKLARAYLQTQAWTQASEVLQSLVALAPDDRWVHYQLGLLRAAFDAGAAQAHLLIAVRDPDYAEVSADVLRALQTDDTEVPMAVGLALAGAELWPQAELAFQHAADNAYPFAEALAYAGVARDWQGKDGSAAVEEAVLLDPRSPIVRYLHGLHLRFAGAYHASREAMTQAVALDPLNPAFYMELGTAYALVDDLDNAERWLKMAVEISDDPRFAEALERFYAESGTTSLSD